ncbi:gamma carbonic anhydrase family protein [Desulfurispirillum indicum]|uniref:Hexapeptide repeat-containing transferase n=1 Tax=Desulfurispirillum indicum (strain ATCC BAA-1389 / DSM 22839 / S5) TaxID=653733 RepID=E6W185_DESIS|nr:gamma carbonic anhydrase family protein [Desulfurispirillum indicum]ADU66505.1 hexapeptide repeat-containing transferase [Desulfurispirillum indicum S5]UCZ55838.1 gamma carbonic anhydrase family protein [Desulfurispirillum indicum]
MSFLSRPYRGVTPTVHESCFVAPTAVLIGDLVLAPQASIWYGAILRADVNFIRVGARTNIQDGAVVHVNGNPSHPTVIGEDVTVGHNVTLHGCHIGDRVLVGMGAIVLNGATIGDDCVIGAGAVVKQGMDIPAGSMVVGNPAVIKRQLSEQERAFLLKSSKTYTDLAEEYLHDS